MTLAICLERGLPKCRKMGNEWWMNENETSDFSSRFVIQSPGNVAEAFQYCSTQNHGHTYWTENEWSAHSFYLTIAISCWCSIKHIVPNISLKRACKSEQANPPAFWYRAWIFKQATKNKQANNPLNKLALLPEHVVLAYGNDLVLENTQRTLNYGPSPTQIPLQEHKYVKSFHKLLCSWFIDITLWVDVKGCGCGSLPNTSV